MDKNRINRPELLSPLSLAYIGDAVYEVFIRNRIITDSSNLPAHLLHKKTVRFVKAHAQSEAVLAIEGLLTEPELAVYKRGRNAKSPTAPKNADITDYRRATGFEALIGYIYLKGEDERLEFIMSRAFEALSGN